MYLTSLITDIWMGPTLGNNTLDLIECFRGLGLYELGDIIFKDLRVLGL
jgi:hypothetical protein